LPSNGEHGACSRCRPLFDFAESIFLSCTNVWKFLFLCDERSIDCYDVGGTFTIKRDVFRISHGGSVLVLNKLFVSDRRSQRIRFRYFAVFDCFWRGTQKYFVRVLFSGCSYNSAVCCQRRAADDTNVSCTNYNYNS